MRRGDVLWHLFCIDTLLGAPCLHFVSTKREAEGEAEGEAKDERLRGREAARQACAS